MRKNIEKNIVICGTGAQIAEAEKVINSLKLPETTSGPFAKNEDIIRLILQNAIDDNNLKADIMFSGNTIIPYKKTIKEFTKHNKSGTLNGLSDYFYHFLSCNCNDIAHYDKNGYINYYGNDFEKVKKEVIAKTTVPIWKTDMAKVLGAINILMEE